MEAIKQVFDKLSTSLNGIVSDFTKTLTEPVEAVSIQSQRDDTSVENALSDWMNEQPS